MHIRYQEGIAETGEALETSEQYWRGTHFADRVRMLRLLKSETAKTLQACASLLGYSERQLLRWWACYKTGGLDALLEQHPRSGRPSRMTQQAREQIDAAMQEGQIDTLEAARQLLQSTCHITYKSINAISWLFKRRKTKWKTGRRQHRKAHPEQQDAFKKAFSKQISALQVEGMVALDEGRFGLKTWFRRRWCPKGSRPPWRVDDRYEWCWLYAAVEPVKGTGVFLLLPDVTGDCLELFLQHLRQELGDRRVGVVLDGSGSHRSRQITWPQNLFPLPLPAYSPELNPTEQVFRHLRKHLSRGDGSPTL